MEGQKSTLSSPKSTPHTLQDPVYINYSGQQSNTSMATNIQTDSQKDTFFAVPSYTFKCSDLAPIRPIISSFHEPCFFKNCSHMHASNSLIVPSVTVKGDTQHDLSSSDLTTEQYDFKMLQNEISFMLAHKEQFDIDFESTIHPTAIIHKSVPNMAGTTHKSSKGRKGKRKCVKKEKILGITKKLHNPQKIKKERKFPISIGFDVPIEQDCGNFIIDCDLLKDSDDSDCGHLFMVDYVTDQPKHAANTETFPKKVKEEPMDTNENCSNAGKYISGTNGCPEKDRFFCNETLADTYPQVHENSHTNTSVLQENYTEKEPLPKNLNTIYFQMLIDIVGDFKCWPYRVQNLFRSSKFIYIEILIISLFGFINKVPVQLLCAYFKTKNIKPANIDTIKNLYTSFTNSGTHFNKYFSYNVRQQRTEYISGERMDRTQVHKLV